MEIEVETIMQRIREEVRKQKKGIPEANTSLPIPFPENAAIPPHIRAVEWKNIEPVMQLPLKERYSVADLVAFKDAAFIKNAYRVILGREVDSSGFSSYLLKLRSGSWSQSDILCAIAGSPEGTKKHVNVDGLTRKKIVIQRSKRFLKERIPVLGYCITWILALYSHKVK